MTVSVVIVSVKKTIWNMSIFRYIVKQFSLKTARSILTFDFIILNRTFLVYPVKIYIYVCNFGTGFLYSMKMETIEVNLCKVLFRYPFNQNNPYLNYFPICIFNPLVKRRRFLIYVAYLASQGVSWNDNQRLYCNMMNSYTF